MTTHLPGPFVAVRRCRPVALVVPGAGDPRIPSRAVEVAPAASGRTEAGWRTAELSVTGWFDGTSTGIDLRTPAGTTTHRSRLHGRPLRRPEGLAVTLTGPQATVLTQHRGRWTVRAKVDLAEAGLEVPWPDLELQHSTEPRAVGRFGHLGLRDLHLVTHADGTPYRRDGKVFVTATHAGPGFFATAHCGVWEFDPESHDLRHHADLWFERDGRVLGDHAVHVVRDGDGWLVTASTWGDFDHDDVGLVQVRTDADLLAGEHVLVTDPLDVSAAVVEGVAVWDPHLALVDGHWHLACVVASEFFVFRPVLLRASVPGRLDGWELLGDAHDRVATEGTQMLRLGGQWRVLASDGPDSPRHLRRRYPVFDLAMREVGALDAPYPSNLPWPTLVEHQGRWLLLTFDGTPYGGRVAGYGTHGDVWVHEVPAARPPG